MEISSGEFNHENSGRTFFKVFFGHFLANFLVSDTQKCTSTLSPMKRFLKVTRHLVLRLKYTMTNFGENWQCQIFSTKWNVWMRLNQIIRKLPRLSECCQDFQNLTLISELQSDFQNVSQIFIILSDFHHFAQNFTIYQRLLEFRPVFKSFHQIFWISLRFPEFYPDFQNFTLIFRISPRFSEFCLDFQNTVHILLIL